MKTATRFSLLFLLFLVAACMPSIKKTDEVYLPTTTLTPEISVIPTVNLPLNEQKLQNMSYLSPTFGVTIQLTNGAYKADSMNISLLPQVAIGDLNNDQVDDAAVLLAENGGGTGDFVSLVVMASRDGKFEQAGIAMIDDRPVIESLTITDGTIQLNAVVHGLNDSMAVPTQKVSLTYKLLENNLTLMKRSSIAKDGMERLIVIDAPLDGSEIQNTFQIKGNMPVAPFENSLQLRILDLAGTILYSDGFMVTSADVGKPATFDNEIKLPAFSSGTWVKVELTELSMADGAVVTMDSVLVKIK